MRSTDVETVTYELVSLENPIVLHLANCKTDEERVAFLVRFGLPRVERIGVTSYTNMGVLGIEQQRLVTGLILSSGNMDGSQTDEANRLLNAPRYGVKLKPRCEKEAPEERPRLVLYPDIP